MNEMDIGQYFILHIMMGMLLTLMVLMFPQEYLRSMKYCLLIIKTVSLKFKNKPDSKSSVIKAQQQEYVQEFMYRSQQESDAMDKSKFQYNLALLKLLILWPAIVLIYILAGILKICYYQDPDLP